ncbi:hypothetical protein [Microtetraspora sp. NBRC 16547]|uniref:hypothetical protein n=1 Tax=Microtetraspora sp. NBRC 16547 TaxID=3030993 RepID=UPI0024A008BE|nr:hypothetical protein [Microtetraspora sp. NBRC 16547]GLX00769.1 hypothetical protein Misp02_48550 [Microtetraspora sp. NBRC 16547]
MARTTPPRPVDIAAVFPELVPLARRAVRLHPRPGQPTIHESSIGGPLLWPADEDWPACSDEHDHWEPPASLDDIRRRRDLLEAAWLRPRPSHENLLTPEQRAYLDKLEAGHPPHNAPNPLLPVAQLYLRDIPGLVGPEGADVLQVLWCPLDHKGGMPTARLIWRDSTDVQKVLTNPPAPLDVDHFGHYVPEPCVLHPEVVTEYPASHELPDELAERLHAWGRAEWAELHPDDEQDDGSAYYQFEHSVAPGWKVGGWGPWSFCDPWPMNCDACGSEYRPLLTISSGEWDGGSGSWIPLEDRDHTGPVGIRNPSDPPMVQIGRGYNMQIYTCPTSFDHPHLEIMQ